MTDVICKCGEKNNYRIVEKATNKMAYCNACDAYIKNIPYDEPKLYVGKYKGIPIKQIEDMPYLRWALKELRLTENVRNAISKQIASFENLAR